MIETEQQLVALLPRLQAGPWVAIDTEADSLHAYPEKLCLLQLSAPEVDELVDPLAGLHLEHLLELLRGKLLILHGADYDLRLLHRTFGFVAQAIFDTMWAARLLGYREFGLSHLVQQHLGVTLEKGPQKMNWALRPLPARMAAYAQNDTRYLHPLAEVLRSELKQRGRSDWLKEVCARVIKDCSQSRLTDPESLWRIRGSDRLDRPSMAVLRELWAWREQEALSANKPPYFIFSHEKLVAVSVAVARGRPTADLIPDHLPAKRSGRLALAIQRALQVPPAKFPHPKRSVGVRLTHQQQTEFDQLKRVRDARAHELGLDPTVIASKADLTLAAQADDPNQAHLMSWQRELLLGQAQAGPEPIDQPSVSAD